MVDPIIALSLAGAGLVVLYILFRPVKGYFWQWQRAMQMNDRVLIEDALKHLYDCEYKKVPATLPSVSGVLSIRGDKTARLVERLEKMELIKSKGNILELTEEGRSYALRIVRLHRLWERYLADKTGVPELEWHLEAEQREHKMTLSEANMLAAQMGDPRFDPHGDPIPTAAGEIPPLKGMALTALPRGEVAEIIHIEDEPEAIYAQLLAQGLHPGMQVQMLDTSAERIHIAAEGEEILLAPVFAANITVSPLTEAPPMEISNWTLSALQPGEAGTVVGISHACRGLQRRRLMDLGVVSGTNIQVEMRSAAGDPTAYKIRGATIALRRSQSNLIYIEKKG
jgi:DtxR family Mn-dependent transcriptional regulator